MSLNSSYPSTTSAILPAVQNANLGLGFPDAETNSGAADSPVSIGPITDIDGYLARFGPHDVDTAGAENGFSDSDPITGDEPGDADDDAPRDTAAALIGGAPPPGGAGTNWNVDPVPLIPVPAPQPDPLVPDPGPGAGGGDGAAAEEPGVDPEPGPQQDGPGGEEVDEVDEEAEDSDDPDQSQEQHEHQSEAPGSKVETGSSSSSDSSSHGGGSSGGSAFNFGGGGVHFGDVGPFVAGGLGASLIGHTLLTGDTGVSGPGGAGNPDSDAPGVDLHAAWVAAAAAFEAADVQMEFCEDEIYRPVQDIEKQGTFIERADALKAAIQAQISSKVAFISANLTDIAHLNTKIAEDEFNIGRYTALTAATQTARQEVQQRSNAARAGIQDACALISATQDAEVWAHQSNIIIEQGNIISDCDKTLHALEAADRTAVRAIERLEIKIQLELGQIARLEAANGVIEHAIIAGESTIVDLQAYIGAKTHTIAMLNDRLPELASEYASAWQVYREARDLMNALSAFQGYSESPEDPEWPEFPDLTPDDSHYHEWRNDPTLPLLPPGYQPPETDAPHTTTTSSTTSSATFVPSEAESESKSESGSHPAAGPTSFNVALDPTADHEASVQDEMSGALDLTAHQGSSASITFGFVFSEHSRAIDTAAFVPLIDDIHAIEVVLAHWTASIDPHQALIMVGVAEHGALG